MQKQSVPAKVPISTHLWDFGLFASLCSVPCFGRSVCLDAEVFKARNERRILEDMTVAAHEKKSGHLQLRRVSIALCKLIYASKLA